MTSRSEPKRRLRRRLHEYSPRDLLAVGLPLVMVVVAGFWLASRYIQPAPPDTLVLATGRTGCGYQRYGAVYKDVLERFGIRVIEETSAGSTENLARLRDPAGITDAAFVQGGIARVQEDDALLSLGDLYYEPLWIFYRADLAPDGEPLTRLTELKGRRLAIDGEGSGARHLAKELLFANQIDARNTRLSNMGGGALLADAFFRRTIDAAFVVGTMDSAAVWTLLHTPGLRLMSLAHADAYTRQFPYLTKLVLPRGAVDVAADLPPRDVRLVAATATLVVRKDTHPALVGLLMQAMSEAHGPPTIFQRQGEFPRPASADFPLSSEAERYYKSGKPFLQRYLPFWAATLLDRMVVMLIPFFAVLVPVLRFAPGLYAWRIRSRLNKSYSELKLIEAELEADPAQFTCTQWHQRVDAIERDVSHLTMPLAFTDLIYNLRVHTGVVRTAIERAFTKT